MEGPRGDFALKNFIQLGLIVRIVILSGEVMVKYNLDQKDDFTSMDSTEEVQEGYY